MPPGATETIREWTRIIHAESNGLSELHNLKPVSPVITHELLIEVNEAVNNKSGLHTARERQRLLTKVIAAAVGGSVTSDDNVLFKVGKRLMHQVGMAQRSQAEIAASARVARSHAQHLAHACPADGAFSACELPAQLARIKQDEASAMNVDSTEIYVGFHELEMPTEDDPKPPSPQRDDDPVLAKLEAQIALEHEAKDEADASYRMPRDLSQRAQDIWRGAFMEGRGDVRRRVKEVHEEAYEDGKVAGREEAAEEIKMAKGKGGLWERLAKEWNDELSRAEARAA